MQTRKKILMITVILLMIGFGVRATQADLLVDRGLPTTYLNDPNGNASNTSLAETEPTIVGDTFSIGNAGQNFYLDSIRVWVVGDAPAATTLYGGYVSNGSAGLSQISTTILSDTVVTYAGGAVYYDGAYPIHQVDFQVDAFVNGGQGFYFFVDGNDPSDSPYLHASNAFLSGSNQDGADNLFWIYNTSTGSLMSESAAFGYWDKPADIDVQVFGTQVPEPSALFLFGFGLLAGAATARRRFKKG